MKYNPKKKPQKECNNPNCIESFDDRGNKMYCSVKCKNAVSNPKRFSTNDIPQAVEVTCPTSVINDFVRDTINPNYYNDGEIECIDAIKASMTQEEFNGYLKGSIMKYVWREKNDKKEDLDKAVWFINKLKEQL